MRKLIAHILEKMSNVCKAQRKFVLEMLIIILSTHGKINFRNMSRYTTYSEKTISRQFRKPFNFPEFNNKLIAEAIQQDAELISAYDQTFSEKSGEKTYGLDIFWQGSESRAKRGLEVGVLGVIDLGTRTGYAISAQQTPPLSEIRKDSSCVADSRIDVHVDHINRDAKYLPPSVLYLVVDGFFYKDKFVSGIRKGCGLHVIGKARHDAHFCYLYEGEQKKRGRPRKRGEKVDFEDLSKFELIGPVEDDAVAYSAIFYSVALKCCVKVIVLVPKDVKKHHVILFSTGLALPALDILRYYKARFQIEFVFRDSKGFTGFCDCQARTKEQLHWHFNISLAALNFAKVQDRLGKQNCCNSAFSAASIKARYFNENFINLIISAFDLDPNLLKSKPIFHELVNLGTISQ